MIMPLTGCLDSKKRTIIGVWEVVPTEESNAVEKWFFLDGNQVYVEIDSVGVDTADYTLTSNVVEYFVNCEGFIRPDNPDWIANSRDGKYRIDFLDSRYMKLQRIANGDGSTGGAFRYIDFQRSQ